MTHPKQPEESLPELGELFNRLFLGLPVGAFVVQNRRFRRFNPRFQKFLGYSRHELLRMNCLEPVHPEDRDFVRENAVKWLKGERFSPYEYRFISKDGMVRWAMETVIPGQYRGKRAALGYFVDITERKQAEEEYRKVQERFSGIYNSSKDAIGYAAIDGTLLDVNDSFCHLTGYSRKELLAGMKYQDMTAKEYQELEARIIEGILRTGKPAEYEKECIRKDGSRVPILLTAFAVKGRDGQSTGLAAVIKDITEQKRLRQTMQHYIAGITRAQEEERKRIARDLHDETAQSLAALLLDIETLSRSGGRFSDNTRQLLEQLRARTDQILGGVRHFSHELRPDVLDQVGLLPALEMLTAELSREGITAYVEVNGCERRLLSETELVLFRIVQEALRNVKKHAKATKAVVRVDFAEEQVKVSIVDNGCGFKPPETLGELVSSGKLGLIGMQERVRLLGGNVSVSSQPGKGTTVAVEVEG